VLFRSEQERQEKATKQAEHDAATRIQRVNRGNIGRLKFDKKKQEHEAIEAQHKAATKLQTMERQHRAKLEVDELRKIKREKDDKAATVIRKYWLRFFYRRKFLNLQKELRMHEDSVVVIQRYVRGFVVRSKMWKDAIRAEEQLWAAVELQRCWRGYLGRVRWELEYEKVFSRQDAASRLQRHIRGWLARTRTDRIRKQRARAEFQRARLRFKAAQRIQALARGVRCRNRINAFKQRKLAAVVKIQSIFRGHQLRVRLWDRVVAKRTVQIQASMRGFLVRNRRFHVLVKVICIQNNYRKWLRWVPEQERNSRSEAWRVSRAEAKAAAEEAGVTAR